MIKRYKNILLYLLNLVEQKGWRMLNARYIEILKNIFQEIFISPKVLNTETVSIMGTTREFMDRSNSPGQISFSPRHISTLPNLGEVDIFRSLQLLPGIQLGLGGHIRIKYSRRYTRPKSGFTGWDATVSNRSFIRICEWCECQCYQGCAGL